MCQYACVCVCVCVCERVCTTECEREANPDHDKNIFSSQISIILFYFIEYLQNFSKSV